jgi:RNA polymerase sigma-70 factor (ECF subfamily)
MTSRAKSDEVARRFVAAWEDGDTEGLVELLAPDATFYGDGGGKAPSIPRPLVGPERIAKALVGWQRNVRESGVVHEFALVNGESGIVFYYPDGRPAFVSALEVAEGVVVTIRIILNPDKLAHIPARP